MAYKVLQTIGPDVLGGTGSPIRVLEISRNLAGRGFGVWASSLTMGGLIPDKDVDGVKVRRIPIANIRTEEGRFFVNVPKLYYFNKKLVKEGGIDIIHSHLSGASSASYFLRKSTGIPYIYDLHGLFPEENIIDGGILRGLRAFPWKVPEYFVRRKASWIVATSDTMRDYLLGKGYPRVESVPVGVVCGFFRPMEKDMGIVKGYGLGGKRVVVHTGNTNPYQGMEDLVESIPDVIRNDKAVIFLIVGGGDYLGYYKNRVKRLGVSGNVVFTGPQPYTRMPSFLSVADIGLSLRTSTFTGNISFPTKLTTYMAAGLPTIATKTGDQKNIISKDTGFLVNSGQPGELSETILDALSDEKRLENQGRLARKYAAVEFSWDVLCEKYVRIYKNILG